ncbi:MAG: class I SAM-dependent methyltransferase [Rhodobiaceae bacterium]|nr:class I SAM-dependent methyltransferase [Rhodobiaceae bacterium]
MGASAKTLLRLMEMTEEGRLSPGASICDIGTSQLSGPNAFETARAFLAYYDERRADGASSLSDDRLRGISNGGLLGEVLIDAGFEYVALDIFEAERTIVFDLNSHTPGPKLVGKFDLVTNFGTTEHVFNQIEAFRTMHLLLKPDGLSFHDLPFSGFIKHGLFRYDPLFFSSLIKSNDYQLVRQTISTGADQPVPKDLISQGLDEKAVKNVGLEVILTKIANSDFKVPLEMSTSIAPFAAGVVDNEYVQLANGKIIYGQTRSSFVFYLIQMAKRVRQALKRIVAR